MTRSRLFPASSRLLSLVAAALPIALCLTLADANALPVKGKKPAQKTPQEKKKEKREKK